MSIRWGQARIEIASLRDYISTRLRNGFSKRKIYDLLRDERRITMSRPQFYHYVKLLEDGRLTVGTPDQYDPTEAYLKHAKGFGKRQAGDHSSPKVSSTSPDPSGTRAVAPLPAPERPRAPNFQTSTIASADLPQLREAVDASLEELWDGDNTTDFEEDE